ncbi:MAG: nucleotidyltransferase domain-containing protein [Deltaproteobacteria bacterium]|nr:nucleotidyltransferase domain-containing protein [Deltaproteobacteria bacterium]
MHSGSVFLFGSYAKVAADESSDVDTAFFFRDLSDRALFKAGSEFFRLTQNCKACIASL